jgi:hypothetical protein
MNGLVTPLPQTTLKRVQGKSLGSTPLECCLWDWMSGKMYKRKVDNTWDKLLARTLSARSAYRHAQSNSNNRRLSYTICKQQWGSRWDFIACITNCVSRVVQSVQRLATGWTVRGSNPDGGKIFRTFPDWPWGPPSLLYNGYRVFPGVESGRGVTLTPHTHLVSRSKNKVELYLYLPQGPLWPVKRVKPAYYEL